MFRRNRKIQKYGNSNTKKYGTLIQLWGIIYPKTNVHV